MAKERMADQVSGGDKTVAPVSVVIKVADTSERVLQLNADEGIILEWNEDDFTRLSDRVQGQLRLDNLKRYLVAERAVDLKAQQASRSKVLVNPFNPLQGHAEAREFIRKRPGWHQCWKNPGREFDQAMAGPYKQVRVPTAEQTKNGFEPGEENGEVLKRMLEDGKVEAIAVECTNELYEQYKAWMDAESTRKYNGIESGYLNSIEEINRKTGKGEQMIVPMVDGKEVR